MDSCKWILRNFIPYSPITRYAMPHMHGRLHNLASRAQNSSNPNCATASCQRGVGVQLQNKQLPAPQLHPCTNGSSSWGARSSPLSRYHFHGCLGTQKNGQATGAPLYGGFLKNWSTVSPTSRSLSLRLGSQCPRFLKGFPTFLNF